jgi:hypothetical protein
MTEVQNGKRPMTLLGTIRAGGWSAERDRHHLDEDLLPDSCPFHGPSAARVWEFLRELQLSYQQREEDWPCVPGQFESLVRYLDSLGVLNGQTS